MASCPYAILPSTPSFDVFALPSRVLHFAFRTRSRLGRPWQPKASRRRRPQLGKLSSRSRHLATRACAREPRGRRTAREANRAVQRANRAGGRGAGRIGGLARCRKRRPLPQTRRRKVFWDFGRLGFMYGGRPSWPGFFFRDPNGKQGCASQRLSTREEALGRIIRVSLPNGTGLSIYIRRGKLRAGPCISHLLSRLAPGRTKRGLRLVRGGVTDWCA